MKDHTAGVSEYDHCTVDIYFPKDNVCCDLCPLLETYARKQCRRTGEYLIETKHAVGFYCPLQEYETKKSYETEEFLNGFDN